MASGGRQFNDSSGDISEQRSQRGLIPQALELKNHLPVTRDSGCFTGSPMTPAPFMFEEDCGTPPRRTGTTIPTQSTPLACDRSFTSNDTDDDDDDVFHLSQDSFVDSGLQSMTLQKEDGNTRRQFKRYRQVADRRGAESDEESSTGSEEFSTAEFELDEASPVSTPIDIPRSNNSSPQSQHLEETGIRHRISSSTPAHHIFPPRRATFSQLSTEVQTQAENYRALGSAPRGQFYSQSTEGAQGPLPDVVPSNFGRCRAMSESFIHSPHYLTRVGSDLRDMCDEFSKNTIKKNINLIEMRQRNTNQSRQGNSYPSANRPRRKNFLERLFSSSHE